MGVSIGTVLGLIKKFGGGGSVDPQDIAEAVDSWCDENITNPDSPPLDRSLTGSSAAAPADLVGDLKSAINELEDCLSFGSPVNIPVTLLSGYVRYFDGSIASSSVTEHTDYVDLRKYDKIYYKKTGYTASNPYGGVAFYNASKEYISGIQGEKSQESNGYVGMELLAVPTNAVYARFTTFIDTTTYGNFELIGYYVLTQLVSDLDTKTEYHIRNGTFENANNLNNVCCGIFPINSNEQKNVAIRVSKPLTSEGNYYSIGYYFLSDAFTGIPVKTGKTIIESHSVDAEGTVRDGDFITVPVNAEGVVFTISERASDTSVVAKRASDYENYKFVMVSNSSGMYSETVKGEKIDLRDQTYYVAPIMTIAHSYNSEAMQDFAIHGNTLFVSYDTGLMKTYNLSTNELIASFDLGSKGETNHSATLNFGNEYFTGNTAFPALYISGDLTNFCAYVESVTQTGSTLKQIISFNLTEHKKATGSMCLVNTWNNKIYYIQRELSSISASNNRLYCCVFNLPLISDGTENNGVLIVELTDSDVIDAFFFDEYRAYYQSGCIANNKIYIVHGKYENPDGSKTGVAVYDLAGKCISKVDTTAFIDNEPEGIDIHNGKMYVTARQVSDNFMQIVFSS
jgi:hypothetical protein